MSDDSIQAAGAVPKFVAGKARSETVLLDWPLEYDGKTIDRITVSRPDMPALEAWRNLVAEMHAKGESLAKVRLPMFDVPPPRAGRARSR